MTPKAVNAELSLARIAREIARPTRWKRIAFYVFFDALVVAAASLLSYAAAVREFLPAFGHFASDVLPFAGVVLAFQVGLSFFLSSYDLRWSTFSLADLPRAVIPGIGTAVVLGGVSLTGRFVTLTPWSALTWCLINICGTIAVRGARRFYSEVVRPRGGKRALIVVCTDKAYFLLDVLRRIRAFQYHFVGFIDPAPGNQGSTVQGVPVLGGFADVEEVVARHRVQAALVLLSANPEYPMNGLYQRLHELGLEVRIIPSFADMLSDRADVGALERLSIHELTGRPPVTVDPCDMRELFGGRRVLVTGAGGSIGSELCRQLCRFEPALVALFERDDSNLFGIEHELGAAYPGIELLPFLGDVTREDDVERAFARVRPEVVFHAAAYKHVPILEFHPAEAVRANVVGSHVVARAAVRHATGRFVYISTDKAVNPTSVMGASKRIGETLVTAMNGQGGTRFIAVRFGNVLDSRGSVSTIFRRSIYLRRPLTLTDPEMKRYLMLTSEAVLLVLQAAAIGQGGEVFVLDMGNPVRIWDLAETMIRHAGLRPEVDIPIVVTGRRPGEKLFEELLTAEEGTVVTINRRIYRARISAKRGYDELAADVARLEAVAGSAGPAEVRAEMLRQVSSYTPDLACLNGRPTASGSAAVAAAE
ncbi:MAG: nucleoside-diphosphate sugar epimerase/dehydratase [bacterium]